MQNDDDLLQLKLLYKNKIPEKIKSLEDQWKLICAACSNEKIIEFFQLVHKFHGSAGSYGYHKLAKNLDVLETQLRELKTVEELSEEQKNNIGEMLKKIKDELWSDENE